MLQVMPNMNLIDQLRESQAHLVEMRRDLHAHPETAFEEHRTAEMVARRLEACGVETHRGVGRTGVVGVLRGTAGQSDRAIGLRADMDALPMTERNTFAHASRHIGKMHACGHDGHTTMLLGAAEYLAQHRDFDGTVVFIFQPAEEGQGGGREMIEDGLFTRFPVQAVFGLHNWPGLPVGQMAVHTGPVMASADEFDITIIGKGAHAAMPNLGIDPVLVGSTLVQALQSIASRNTHPVDSVVVSVTKFHAGEAHNVIADRAELGGTMRAFRHEVREATEAALRRICAGVAATYGVQIDVNVRHGYPPTVNSATEAALCATVAQQVLGNNHVHTNMQPTMGAEDFAYMLLEKPGCYVWLGNGDGEHHHDQAGPCTLHNPHYDFNDHILPLGVAYWVSLVRKFLSNS